MKNCDINYKEMNCLIKNQDNMHLYNNRNNPYKRCPKKFRKAQTKKHIVPITLRGLVCDISHSEGLSNINPDNENTRSISIRGEDGILYNFITSYKKRIVEFKESMDSNKDIIISAYINKRHSNKTVKRLCSAGHSKNVSVDILYNEESLIENS